MRELRGRGSALSKQFRQDLQLGQAHGPVAVAFLLEYPAGHGQVRRATREYRYDLLIGALPVIGRRAADAKLVGEHAVDPADPLRQPDAFEGVDEDLAARLRRGYQQVVQANAFGEPSRTGHLELFL